MAMPYERTPAIFATRQFLRELMVGANTLSVSEDIRRRAVPSRSRPSEREVSWRRLVQCLPRPAGPRVPLGV